MNHESTTELLFFCGFAPEEQYCFVASVIGLIFFGAGGEPGKTEMNGTCSTE